MHLKLLLFLFLISSLPTIAASTTTIETPNIKNYVVSTAQAQKPIKIVIEYTASTERKETITEPKNEAKTSKVITITIPLPIQKIPTGDLIRGKIMEDAGPFGAVHRGTWRGSPVAIKVFSLKTLPSHLLSEFEVYTKAHPDLVHFYGICIDPGKFAMVTELMHESLRDFYLKKSLEELDWLRFLIPVARGLMYLHSEGIAHKHLKSSNILLTEDLRVKINDYGLSKLKLEASSNGAASSEVKVRWRAPETFTREYARVKDIIDEAKLADYYSFAITLYEVVAKAKPFPEKSESEVVQLLTNKEHPANFWKPETIESVYSKKSRDFIDQMSSSNPKERHSLEAYLVFVENLAKEKEAQAQVTEDLAKYPLWMQSYEMIGDAKNSSVEDLSKSEFAQERKTVQIVAVAPINEKELSDSDKDYINTWIYFLLELDPLLQMHDLGSLARTNKNINIALKQHTESMLKYNNLNQHIIGVDKLRKYFGDVAFKDEAILPPIGFHKAAAERDDLLYTTIVYVPKGLKLAEFLQSRQSMDDFLQGTEYVEDKYGADQKYRQSINFKAFFDQINKETEFSYFVFLAGGPLKGGKSTGSGVTALKDAEGAVIDKVTVEKIEERLSNHAYYKQTYSDLKLQGKPIIFPTVLDLIYASHAKLADATAREAEALSSGFAPEKNSDVRHILLAGEGTWTQDRYLNKNDSIDRGTRQYRALVIASDESHTNAEGKPKTRTKFKVKVTDKSNVGVDAVPSWQSGLQRSPALASYKKPPRKKAQAQIDLSALRDASYHAFAEEAKNLQKAELEYYNNKMKAERFLKAKQKAPQIKAEAVIKPKKLITAEDLADLERPMFLPALPNNLVEANAAKAMDYYLHTYPNLRRMQVLKAFEKVKLQLGDEVRLLDEDELHDQYEESFSNKYGQCIPQLSVVMGRMAKNKTDPETVLFSYMDYVNDTLNGEAKYEEDKLFVKTKGMEITLSQNDIYLIVDYILGGREE